MRGYLKELRTSKGLSQQNVAERIHKSRQNYNQIENGERQKDMNISLAQKLADVFDVPIEFILENERKGA